VVTAQRATRLRWTARATHSLATGIEARRHR
jgi:hypothetical protein